MTINQLKYFIAIAEKGNMNRAAESLYISQPSLSAAVRKLEEELGIELFERRGHHIQLNHSGRMFLEHAKKMLEEYDLAVKHMMQLSKDQNTYISIGCISSLFRNYFPEIMSDFLGKTGRQDIQFQFSTERTAVLIDRLKMGMYDIVLCSAQEDPAILQIPIIREPLVLIASEGKLPQNTEWSAIEKLPLIGYEEGARMDMLIGEYAKKTERSSRSHTAHPRKVPLPALWRMVSAVRSCPILPKSHRIPSKNCSCREKRFTARHI
ncbi:MAG: LysR family transcriptional regulator [Christensenellaceae bacterium]|nr:LysR family transcriptional regulator [Christensenellaceae bacterium]